MKTAIKNAIEDEIEAHKLAQEAAGHDGREDYVTVEYLQELHEEMLEAAKDLDFERAALLRDQIAKLKGEKVATAQVKKGRGKARRGR